MKIESYSPTKPAAEPHPLAAVVERIKELAPGGAILVSDIPMGMMGDSVETFGSRLVALGSPAIRIEYGDNFRTPSSYIITRDGAA